MRNIDYSGKRFSRWTIVSPTERATRRGKLWIARCDCGVEKVLYLANILNGRSKSCGCFRQDAPKSRLLPNGASARNMIRELYRINANKRGLDWGLSDGYFVELTSSNCHYCGSAPSTVRKKRGGSSQITYNGIDRIDSSKGYIEGNVVPCCPPCNRAKSNMSYTDFMFYLDRLTAFHSGGQQ